MASVSSLLSQLEALGDPKVRNRNAHQGAGSNQFGVPMGEIRKIAAKIRIDQQLALELWGTGNLEARLLAILILKPAKLTRAEVDMMVRTGTVPQLADWINSYVVKKHPDKEALRQAWLADNHPWAARSGWTLMSERIARDPDGIDIPAVLDRIEAEMGAADPATQWTMNSALASIGIHHPDHRKRAMAIGEKLGIYRDYPVSKGCTSPFAPIWIAEMVRRQGEAER